jgi:hypothetical protein
MLVTSVAVFLPYHSKHTALTYMYTLTSVWLVTQFEGLELPVLGLNLELVLNLELETRLFSELVTEWGSQFYLFVELELELELRCWG